LIGSREKFEGNGWGANKERKSRKMKIKLIERPALDLPGEAKPAPNWVAYDLF
jgi:hypothetical protein